MNLIQLGLFISAVGALAIYLRFLRSALIDRLLALVFFLMISLAIFFPDLTTRIANIFGVGRGTDLVFYLFAMGSLFVFIMLYSKIARSEEQLTTLVRELAVRDAAEPK